MQEDVRAAIANSFLSEVDPDIVHRLVEQAIPLDLEAGAILYPEEGEPRMALVVSGLLRVYLTSAEGRQITVRYAREGDVLGTAVAVAGPVRTPVQAVTDARVLLLSVAAVRRLAQTNASVAWAFAQEVTRRSTTCSTRSRARPSLRSKRALLDIYSTSPSGIKRLNAGRSRRPSRR
jgi:CRP/FNR family transcriptional regulator, cyclic AMP receptor protein